MGWFHVPTTLGTHGLDTPRARRVIHTRNALTVMSGRSTLGFMSTRNNSFLIVSTWNSFALMGSLINPPSVPTQGSYHTMYSTQTIQYSTVLIPYQYSFKEP